MMYYYEGDMQNHKGAMMEMGESVCKLRKLNLEAGPFHEFEKDLSTVLNFIYQTQLELAACQFLHQLLFYLKHLFILLFTFHLT